MKFEYTLEEIKNADYAVHLTFDKKGFREEKVDIVKVTPKKVSMGKNIYVGGSYKVQLYHHEIGANITNVSAVVGKTNDILYISKTVLLLEKDIEEAKQVILKLAKERYDAYISQLNNQIEVINSLIK